MPTNTFQRYRYLAKTLEETATATGARSAVLLSGELSLQITGTATAITIQMQRSTRDPASGSPNWAPVGDPVTGNPATGLQVTGFYEPGAAWWRANVTALTGANAVIAISGGAAE